VNTCVRFDRVLLDARIDSTAIRTSYRLFAYRRVSPVYEGHVHDFVIHERASFEHRQVGRVHSEEFHFPIRSITFYC
jgi:hypothetical protein